MPSVLYPSGLLCERVQGHTQICMPLPSIICFPANVSPNQLVFGCTSPSSAVLQGSFSAQYWPWAFLHWAQLSHDLPMLLSKMKTLLCTGWVIVMLTSSLLLKCKPSRIAALQLQFPNKQSSFYTLRL